MPGSVACLLGATLLSGCGHKNAAVESSDSVVSARESPEVTSATEETPFSAEVLRAELARVLSLETIIARHAGMAEVAVAVPTDSMEAAMDVVMGMEIPFRDLDLPILVLVCGDAGH